MAEPTMRTPQNVAMVFYLESTQNYETGLTKGHEIPVSNRSFYPKEQSATTKRRPTSFNPVRKPRGLWVADGNVEVIAEEVAIGMMIHAMLGAATVTGSADTYTHTWKINDSAAPSLTVAERDYTSDKEVRANGVRVVGFQVEAKKESSELVITFDLLGTGKKSINASPLDNTPATYVGATFSCVKVGCKIDSVLSDLVSSVRVTGKRWANASAGLNQQCYSPRVHLGGWQIDFELTGEWSSDSGDLELLASGQAEHALELIFPADTGSHELSLKFEEMECVLNNAPAFGQEDGVREISVSGTAFYSNGSSASAMIWKLICGTAVFANAWDS